MLRLAKSKHLQNLQHCLEEYTYIYTFKGRARSLGTHLECVYRRPHMQEPLGLTATLAQLMYLLYVRRTYAPHLQHLLAAPAHEPKPTASKHVPCQTQSRCTSAYYCRHTL